MWDEQPAKAGLPRWMAVGIGVLGLTAAALLVVARVYDLRKARAEAARAQAEAARVERERPPAPRPVEKAAELAVPGPKAAKTPAEKAEKTEKVEKTDPPAPPPGLIPVYKVAVPGDVILTTSAAEVGELARKHPGGFTGDAGHADQLFALALAGPQPGAVRLRRYSVGTRHVYTTREVANPNYREVPLGAWVYEAPHPGTSLRVGLMRKSDAAMNYTPADETDALVKQGYAPTELRFYAFDPPGGRATPATADPPPPPARRVESPPRVPVYKLVFPGDVILTTNLAEARAIGAKFPGDFRGAAGHHQGVIGYAYPDEQPGARRLQRYLIPNSGRHTYWVGTPTGGGHKPEGPPIWVPSAGTGGATRRVVVVRKDAAGKNEYEYGTERLAESFRQQHGYQPAAGRDFYLFDKADGP